MFINQISVFMENRPGRLAEITQCLSENKIDIRAINTADTTEYGILRMIVDNPKTAEKVLRDNNMTVSITEVIAVSIEDKVGSFSDVIMILKKESVSIEYVYSFLGEKLSKAVIVIKTDDNISAVSKLHEHKINTLSAEDLGCFNYA